MSKFAGYEELRELQEETANFAKKTRRMFLLASSSAIATCALLLQEFKALIGSTRPVKLPVIDFEVPLGSYMFAAPLIVLVLLLAGHAFLGRVEARANENIFPSRQDYFFTTRTTGFQAFSDAMLYVIPIPFFNLLYIYFFFRPEADFLFLLLVLANILFPVLHFTRFWRTGPNWRRGFSWVFLGAALLFLAGSLYVHQVLNAEPFGKLHRALVKPDLRETNFTELLNPKKDAESPTPVNLDGRCLAGADFSHLDLSGSSFRGANLKGAKFSSTTLHNVDFSGAYLFKATFQDVRAERADFSHSYLGAAEFLGTETRFVQSSFEDANFKSSTIFGPIFEETNFARTSFQNANVRDTTFHEGSMQCVDFQAATFLNVDFTNLDATHARFNFGQFSDVRIKKAVLTEASFWKASVVAKAMLLSDEELSTFPTTELETFKRSENSTLIMSDVNLEKVFGLVPLWERIYFLNKPLGAIPINLSENADLINTRLRELCGWKTPAEISKARSVCQ